MSVQKYNKGSKFNATLTGLEFVKLEEVFKMSEDEKATTGKKPVFTITGIFINNKSKFGPRPFVSTPGFLVDLPSHMLDTAKEMLTDDELIKEINDGKVGFTVRAYYSNRYNKDCFSVDFVDKEPATEKAEEVADLSF